MYIKCKLNYTQTYKIKTDSLFIYYLWHFLELSPNVTNAMLVFSTTCIGNFKNLFEL